jgi:hypothetical protein
LLLSAGLYHVLKKRKILQENKQTDVKENLLDEDTKNDVVNDENPETVNVEKNINESENQEKVNVGNDVVEDENPDNGNVEKNIDGSENPDNGNVKTDIVENENPNNEAAKNDIVEDENSENGNVKTDIVENENQEKVSDEEFNKLLNKMGEIKNLFDKIISTNIKEKDIKEFKEKCEKFHQYYSEDFQKIFKGINDNKKDKDKVVHLLIIYCCTDAATFLPRKLLKKINHYIKGFLPDNQQIGKERNYFKRQIKEHQKIIEDNNLLNKLFRNMIKIFDIDIKMLED